MSKRILHYKSSATALPLTIGLATQLKDYRLVHLINQNGTIPFVLSRAHDFPVATREDDTGYAFPLYVSQDEEAYNEFTLLANRFMDQVLIPELKWVDYLLFIEGTFGFQKQDALVNALRQLPDVLMASVLDMKQIRQFPFMVQDLEMHLMQKE